MKNIRSFPRMPSRESILSPLLAWGNMFTICVLLLSPMAASAWIGFDAETTELVEVTPENIPTKGDTIVVHDIPPDSSTSCLVREVLRNPHTTELRVATPQGTTRVLVLEGK